MAVRLGAETYRSPQSVWPSQVTTVLRKLPTISPTPMVTETATISAATATAVRLNAPVTLRGAIRPSVPKIACAGAATRRETISVKIGASNAKPIVRKKMPAKLTANPCPELAEEPRVGTANNSPPTTIPITQRTLSTAPAARAVSSRPERVSAWRGETAVASHAGSAAATTVANTPASAPLARLATGIAIRAQSRRSTSR